MGSRSYGSVHSVVQSQSNVHARSCRTLLSSFIDADTCHSAVGYYDGELVSITDLSGTNFCLTINDELELKEMRTLSHDNLNNFVGLCIDKGNECMIFNYCNKGSLQHIILDEDIKLDITFQLSIISDLINGLNYLHNSPLKVHGCLSSASCVITSRWVLKITNFGLLLHRLAKASEKDPDEAAREQFWTAPEVLRGIKRGANITQTSDIYSFGIIVYEVLHRRCPYDTSTVTPEDVVARIRKGEFPQYRPVCDVKSTDADGVQLITVMKTCWSEAPSIRPTAADLKGKMKRLFRAKRFSNIMDHMLVMMETYANNLEDLVKHRTEELTNEKTKVDALLYRMLPAVVADSLKMGQMVPPMTHDHVTIYFSDIVGFTTISALSTPIQVIDLLNQLYTMFDNIIETFDVYKVETIGDSYMVASGLPKPNGNRHASQIADMALRLLSSVLTFEIGHLPEVQLQMRIGLHTGACCAGVVGQSMPRYCLFGDTINTASRMESHGEAMRIHITEATKEILERDPVSYEITERGVTSIKGKGNMSTYWLVNKQGFDGQLPTASDFIPNIGPDGLRRRKPIVVQMLTSGFE